MNEIREFLYVIRPTRLAMLTDGPTPEEARIVSDHFEYLKRLAADGVVQLAGRTLREDDSAFGLVVFRAESEAAARAVMEGDPAVREGVMRAELHPYRIAVVGSPGAGPRREERG